MCWSCRADCRRRGWRAASGAGTAVAVGCIEDSRVNRLEAVPEGTQQLLLVATAEPTGDPRSGAGRTTGKSPDTVLYPRSQRVSSIWLSAPRGRELEAPKLIETAVDVRARAGRTARDVNERIGESRALKRTGRFDTALAAFHRSEEQSDG